MNLCNLMHNGVKRTTKRGQFLADMEKIVPYAVCLKPIYINLRTKGKVCPLYKTESELWAKRPKKAAQSLYSVPFWLKTAKLPR